MLEPIVAAIVDDIAGACQRGDAGAFSAAVARLSAHFGITAPEQAIGPGLAFRTLLPAGDTIGRAMAAVGLEWALPQLDVLVGDRSHAIRCVACRALGQIGALYPAAVVAPAHRLGGDPSWEVREFIANALDEIMGAAQGDFVFALMAEWVHDADANVRRVPTNALMRYGRRNPERVIRLMAELRHDESRYVRDNVVFCLAIMGAVRVQLIGGASRPESPQRLLLELREWLLDDNVNTRWIVAKTLGRTWAKACPAEAVAMLHELEAMDERRAVRTAVASSLRALAKMGAVGDAVADTEPVVAAFR
jgi:HEAT repeat protein